MYEVYHEKALTLDLEKFLPTSNTIRLHIQCAYLQSHLWYQAPFNESIDIDIELYGYVREEDDLHPIISDVQEIPDTFPLPCRCKKCAHGNVCPCRSKNIPCCKYCKCQADCKNPLG